jgi:hypothetical protein
LPDTLAVPTVVPPEQSEGALDSGPNTLKVSVPPGEDPPESAAETEEAAIALPAIPAPGALNPSAGLAVGVPVKPLPLISTATHCETELQATPKSELAPVILAGVEPPGEPGSNLTSFPLPSTAVHCDPDPHDTETRTWPGSTVVIAPTTAPEPGSNVTS